MIYLSAHFKDCYYLHALLFYYVEELYLSNSVFVCISSDAVNTNQSLKSLKAS